MYHVGHVMYMRGSSAKIDDFVENFEECSFSSCLSGCNRAVYEDIGACILNSESSLHMTGMRSVFLNVSEIDSD